MEEQRSVPRQKALLSAKISFNNYGSTLSCVVRNLSQGGARLEFESFKDVPEEFDLLLTDRDQRFPCKVVWRKGNLVGVQFA